MSLKIDANVFINTPGTRWHRRRGRIIDKKTRGYPYLVKVEGERFAYWFPKCELSTEPIPAPSTSAAH